MIKHIPSLLLLPVLGLPAAPVATVDELVAAVNHGSEGAIVEIAAGTFELTAPLQPKKGMTLKGHESGKTLITHAPSWKGDPKGLPDPEMNPKGIDTGAYLVALPSKVEDVTIKRRTC